MKIAILLAGHLRTWERCKNNFIETLSDVSNHEIDIFVDTYDQMFRTDYAVHNEQNFQRCLLKEDIVNSFHGLNVVSFSMEPEVLGIAHLNQARKLLKVFDTFSEYEAQNGIYDLVVKTRPDIKILEKVNYSNIHSECSKFIKKLFISKGGVNCLPLENDLLAISTSDIMKLYMNRFRIYSDIDCTHSSLGVMARKNQLLVENTIPVSIIRP